MGAPSNWMGALSNVVGASEGVQWAVPSKEGAHSKWGGALRKCEMGGCPQKVGAPVIGWGPKKVGALSIVRGGP